MIDLNFMANQHISGEADVECREQPGLRSTHDFVDDVCPVGLGIDWARTLAKAAAFQNQEKVETLADYVTRPSVEPFTL